MNNKISIIIPVYNTELYLERCLNSVIRQKYENFECILVNDGSTDSSEIICQKYCNNDNRFTLINQNNKGVSCARNAGLLLATGDWISFIDSDDWVEENIYTECLQNKDIENIDVFQYGYYKCGEKSKKKYYGIPDIYEENYYISPMYHGCWSRLFRKQLIVNNRLKFLENCSMAEDLLFSFSCLIISSKRVFNINKGLYNYYENINGAVSNLSRKKINDEVFAIQEIQKIYEIQGILDYKSLMRYKEEAKVKFLLSLDKPDFFGWETTFPEITRYLLCDFRNKYWPLYVLSKLRFTVLIIVLLKVKRKLKRFLR